MTADLHVLRVQPQGLLGILLDRAPAGGRAQLVADGAIHQEHCPVRTQGVGLCVSVNGCDEFLPLKELVALSLQVRGKLFCIDHVVALPDL